MLAGEKLANVSPQISQEKFKELGGDRRHTYLGKSEKTIWKVGIEQRCHIEIEFKPSM